ncbi:hypothetical protein TIFTF001_032000 [Ficus carica]|uniref:Pentatricopeptide repeat-containing protein n=1 Tax=Ficus carica TaxID=3494 RepID=A0AA88DWE7_FICCA|nr:hypothetical protein TIFTF001_031955 [Ficus carica]GMN62921.1 hypothetical protein TIFTF001_032000 [Ficus carica]
MIQMRPLPSIRAFNLLLVALSNLNHHSTAVSIHREIVIYAPRPPNAPTTSTLLHGLCKEGSTVAATESLREMEEKDPPCNQISYATVINGPIIDSHCKERRIDAALDLIEAMTIRGLKPNIVTYNSLICGLCRSSQWSEAIKLFEKMDAFSKEGRMQETLAIFSQLIRRDLCLDVVTYSSIISGLCLSGQLKKAKSFLDDMVRRYIYRNTVILIGVLNAYSEIGMMDEAQEIFEKMASKGVMPVAFSYCTLVEMAT